MPQRILNRRQGFADARVINHPPILERNVEIDPREDVLAGDVGIPDGARPVHG